MARRRTDLTAARDAAVADEARARFRAATSSPMFQASLDAVTRAPARTRDSFQNFGLNLGMGTDNALSGSTYGFNPITRNRILLEWMHRGSWLAGVAVDLVGDDMTRAGIEVTSDLETEDKDVLNEVAVQHEVWPAINDTVRWSRLYGGALAVILIDGARMDTPLDVDKVGPGQFKGLLVLDRWQVEPSLQVVSTLGPRMGNPEFYTVSTNAPGLHGQRIHHSRCLRLDGVRLPYNQRLMENLWGISVLERLYDRMVAFDSATQGAAQLVYKSYIRTYKIKDLRKNIGGNPDVMAALLSYVDFMRRYQGIEGVTLIDDEDDFVGNQQSSFTGISDALMQFGQQLAGALQIPLVRLFGMSPTGFSATGESDLRTYYDGIKQRQERDLRVFVDRLYRIMAATARIDLGKDFQFQFQPLWQMTEEQRASVAGSVTGAVASAFADGIVTKPMALRELVQSGRDTGIWATITKKDIEEAEQEPPPDMEGMGGPPGMGGPEDPYGELPPEGEEFGDPDTGGPPVDEPPRDERRLRLVRDHGIVPGLDVVLETPKGTTRFPHRTQLAAHYGFFAGTLGADGDAVDCYVGPEPTGGHDCWVIEQLNPATGVFDEYKCMVGFPSRTLALRAYQRSFDDGLGSARVGSVQKMSPEQLRDWLRTDAPRRPTRAA